MIDPSKYKHNQLSNNLSSIQSTNLPLIQSSNLSFNNGNNDKK